MVEGRTGKDQVGMLVYWFRVQSRVKYIGLYFSSHYRVMQHVNILIPVTCEVRKDALCAGYY